MIRTGRPQAGIACVLLAALLVGACAMTEVKRGPTLTGVVAVGGPLVGATVTVADANGQKRSTKTGADGVYTLDASGLVAPVILSAVEAGNDNCTNSARLWSRCMASVLATLSAGESRANINALTDKIVSDVAQVLRYRGPQGIVDAGTAKGVKATDVEIFTEAQRPVFLQALRDAGVADAERFDPVTTPMKADRKGVDAVLEVLVHNRGYDNNTGVPGGTLLLDADYRYVGKMDAKSAIEPLDLKYAQAALTKTRDAAYTRILIVGDSTASTYERARLPRMGWGQVFEPLFRPEAKVKVLNGAKSGRSARAFINQAYFAQMAAYLRPGDYVFIHMGHNDQNCEGDKKDRGAADVANLCSYPNDANGEPQFPPARPEMSFQKTLETYVSVARAKGAIPVIMTPTTRVWNKDRKEGFPVAPNHFTRQNAAGGFAFVGDYSQTIRDTAKANKLPLIDIEAKTIAFANAHQADWKDYWLAADPAKFPWYATQSAGTLAKPDTTHFQQKGAEAVAAMIAEGIRETPELKALAAKLK